MSPKTPTDPDGLGSRCAGRFLSVMGSCEAALSMWDRRSTETHTVTGPLCSASRHNVPVPMCFVSTRSTAGMFMTCRAADTAGMSPMCVAPDGVAGDVSQRHRRCRSEMSPKTPMNPDARYSTVRIYSSQLWVVVSGAVFFVGVCGDNSLQHQAVLP